MRNGYLTADEKIRSWRARKRADRMNDRLHAREMMEGYQHPCDQEIAILKQELAKGPIRAMADVMAVAHFPTSVWRLAGVRQYLKEKERTGDA